MYYFCRKSRSKVVHSQACAHIRKLCREEIGIFTTLEAVKAAGYRLCRHCNPLAKLYRREHKALQHYCRSHTAVIAFRDSFISVSTPISNWQIIVSGNGRELLLYHKNNVGTKAAGPVPGYHLQMISRDSIMGYLEYISEHDIYRNMHPNRFAFSKKNSPPPLKGTKRYRKEQKKAAKRAKWQSVNYVNSLLDSLKAQSQAAGVG